MADEWYRDIVVIGAGLGGIAAGVKLRGAGFEDFVVLEKADDVGGTWRANTYPGLTVDVPTITYSYSFAQNPNWSTFFAPQPELLQYCRDVAERHGLRPHLRFGAEVAESRFDPATNRWHTRLVNGETYSSRYLISATGFLSVPRWPDIEGIEDFRGTTLHTSQWSSEIDLAGKRVAFIGTGATGIQLIPEIARLGIDSMHVFQRTPIWLLPKADLAVPEVVKTAFRRFPPLMWLTRFLTAAFMDLVFFRVFINYPQVRPLARYVERTCLRHLRAQVDDPDTVQKLTPDYDWGCKRPSFSNVFYPVFNRADVELVTEPIRRLTEHGIVTADGVERTIDVLVCGTGFHPYGKESTPTYPVYGRDGVALAEFWDENRYQAFRGFAISGYPNYFMIGGPYSIAHSSYVGMIETTVRYIVRLLRAARDAGADHIEVRPEAQAAEYAEVLRKRRNEIFFVGNCATANSYYYDRFGDTPNFRPGYHPGVWLDSRLGRFVRYFDIRRSRSRASAESTASVPR